MLRNKKEMVASPADQIKLQRLVITKPNAVCCSKKSRLLAMRLAEQRRWWTSLNAQKKERLIQQAIHHTIQKSLALQIFSTSQTFAHIQFVAHSVTGNLDGAGNILFKNCVFVRATHVSVFTPVTKTAPLRSTASLPNHRPLSGKPLFNFWVNRRLNPVAFDFHGGR